MQPVSYRLLPFEPLSLAKCYLNRAYHKHIGLPFRAADAPVAATDSSLLLPDAVTRADDCCPTCILPEQFSLPKHE